MRRPIDQIWNGQGIEKGYLTQRTSTSSVLSVDELISLRNKLMHPSASAGVENKSNLNSTAFGLTTEGAIGEGGAIDAYYILKSPAAVTAFVSTIAEMTLEQTKWATDITIMPDVRQQIKLAVINSMHGVIQYERETQQ